MTIVDVDDNQRLGITHKGIGVVEHYLMARRLMTRNIYHSQKKLAIEALLVQLLARLAERLDSHAPYASIRETRLGKFLLAANQFNREIVSGKNGKGLKKKFLEENYANYKELCDYDVFALIKQLAEVNDNDAAAQIAMRLHHRKMPHIVRFDYANLPKVESALTAFKAAHQKEIQDWQLMIVETPHQSYSGEDDPILVVNERGGIQPLSKFSILIDAISDKLEHIAFLCIDRTLEENKHVAAFFSDVQSHTMATMSEAN